MKDVNSWMRGIPTNSAKIEPLQNIMISLQRIIYPKKEDCSYHNTNQKATDLTLKIFRRKLTTRKFPELITNVVNSLVLLAFDRVITTAE